MRDFRRIFSYFMYNSCLAIFLTYGLFFTRVAKEFVGSPTLTSLVFATFAILYGFSSLLSGILVDRLGPSKAIIIGGSLMGSGLMLSSVANSLPILVLTYGVIGGAGTGSMFPSTTYAVFDKSAPEHVKTDTGIVSAGTAFGSLFFAPLEAYLISTVEWRLTFVVLGALVLVFAGTAATAAAASRGKDEHVFRLALRKARSRRFAALYSYYTLGNAFARSLVMVFIVPMLEFQGASLFVGSVALAMIGAGSIFGRLTTSLKWSNEEQISGLSFMVQGVSAFLLLFTKDLATIAVLSFIFGVGYGGYIPEFALLIRKYFGINEYGALFGLLLTSYALGAFAGPIFEGFSFEVSGSFAFGFYVAAATSFVVGAHQFLMQRPFSGARKG